MRRWILVFALIFQLAVGGKKNYEYIDESVKKIVIPWERIKSKFAEKKVREINDEDVCSDFLEKIKETKESVISQLDEFKEEKRVVTLSNSIEAECKTLVDIVQYQNLRLKRERVSVQHINFLLLIADLGE